MKCEHCDDTLVNPTGKMTLTVFWKAVSDKYLAEDCVNEFVFPFTVTLHYACEQGILERCQHTSRDRSFAHQSIIKDEKTLEKWNLCEECASEALWLWSVL